MKKRVPTRRPRRVINVELVGNNIKEILGGYEMGQREGSDLAATSYRHFNRVTQ